LSPSQHSSSVALPASLMALLNGSFPLLVQLPSSSVGLVEGEVEGPAVGSKDGDVEGEGVLAGRVGARVGA